MRIDKLALLGVASAIAIATLVTMLARWERWPEVRIDPSWQAMAEEAVIHPRAREFMREQAPYSADGPYFDYATLVYREGPRRKLDTQGLPTDLQGNFNPVTLAQFSLAAYGKYLIGGPLEPVTASANKLVEIQSEDGAFRYPFAFRHYTQPKPLEPGWTSGMGQGVAMSALARAYHVTGDATFLDAGNKALDFLELPFPAGPTSDLTALHPSLSGYVFFLEYPTDPNVLTLNGFMFTLLGLHDWAVVAGSDRAQELFDEGIRSLKRTLPYYDLGAITAYDLSHLIIPERTPHIAPRYHSIHIEQLEALFSVTGEDELKRYAIKWARYGINNASLS